jgi:hypothetical protein
MVDQGGIALTRVNLEKYNAFSRAFPRVECWGEWVLLDLNAYGVVLAKAYWRERGYSLHGFIKLRGNEDQQ